MDIKDIESKITNRIPKPMDSKGKYAVLIALIENEGIWEVIYELRSKSLRSQPGEVSFPGGRVEEGETFKQAAIRETMEELNLKMDNIKVLGELDYLVSYANFSIHCFVGIISGITFDKIVPSEDEVDIIFTVPLEYFLENDPDRYELDFQTVGNDEFPYELIPKGKDYRFRSGKHSVLFYKYKEHIIWGYTAKMTRHLIEIIKDL